MERDRITYTYDVISMGETMMAFEALEYGPLRENHLFKKWMGGAECNFLIGLSRLGFHCGWFSRLGEDEFGKEIYRTLKGEGVDVSRVKFDPRAPTGLFVVERQSVDDFRCYYYRENSAASHLSPPDIDPDYIREARILYLTGITPAISGTARATVEELFNLAIKNSQTLIFDPNLRLKLWDIDLARQVLVPLMKKSTYVLPGENELKLLMNCDQLNEAIRTAHKQGIPRLIIKRGAKGAVVALAGSENREIPPYEICHPISSMGAGDCFAAGFTAGLIRQKQVEECAHWGNALGSFCLMGSGPYQTLPEAGEFQSFLNGKMGINR
ncbi:MAG: sugar kinase [Desulfobacteraceae bacterium]|nr:MAG: sugar kinase [Desulfobacteraceae bacterium]